MLWYANKLQLEKHIIFQFTAFFCINGKLAISLEQKKNNLQKAMDTF